MSEVKIREIMAQAKHEAIEAVIPADAVQIDSGVFILKTESGLSKISVGALKDQEFDVDAAHQEYLEKVAAREAKAAEKAAEKAAKEAAKS